ncbi:MAG: hypothetical protein JJT94_17665, partial [Bernardetiaceae bacterium]|nr:hypothetical protein [Bernardetiaceae bacterium]
AGKTTSALKYFRHYIKKKDANAVVLYCAPLQAIVKQVGNEFTDMQVVCEGETNANIASLHSDTITTYQSVKILFKRFKDANIQPYLIIDEFHELVKSAYQDTQELLNNFELCKKVVGLTATPEPFKELFENIDFYTNEKYNNFEFLHCKQIKHTKYNVSYQIIKNDQIIPKIADLVKGCKGNSLVFREKKNKDSKNNIYEIAEVLITQNQNSSALSGGLSVKEKQQNEVFKALTEEESLLEKQHLIATSVIQTGVSIKHNIAQVIYVANKYDLSSFIQAINRVRKTDINVHLLIIDSDSEKRKNESFDMNIIRKAKNAFHNEIKKRNELMKIASGLDSDLQEQIAKLPALANNMKYNNKISYSKHVKNYYIDYMRIAYESFDKHIKSISKECFLTAVQNFEGVALSSVNDKEANSKTQFDSLVYKEINSYQKSVLSEAIKSSQLRDCIYTHVYENTDSEALQYKIKQLQSEEQFAGLSTKYSELVSDSQYSKGLDLRITTLQKKILKARAKKQDYQNELNALQTVKTKITALQSKELIDCIDYNKEYAIKLINRLYELNKASANCITIENAIQIARSSDGVYGLFLKRLQHISVIEVEGYIIFDIELYKYKDKYVFDKLEQAKKDKAFIANPVQFESNFKSEQAFKAFKEVFFYKDTNELVTLNSLIGSFASQAYHDKFKNIDLEGLAKLLKVA